MFILLWCQASHYHLFLCYALFFIQILISFYKVVTSLLKDNYLKSPCINISEMTLHRKQEVAAYLRYSNNVLV